MESAIPSHLQTVRTQPSSLREDWAPPSPAFSARFGESLSGVVMAYLGVQYRGARPETAASAIAALHASLQDADAPVHHDHAVVVDPQGYTNEIAALYWHEPAAYERWTSAHPAWTSPDKPEDGLGYFLELAAPAARDFETIFGGRRMEGVAVGSNGIGGEIAEHGYWGSMRDRLPSSQDSDLAPDGELRAECRGDLVVVHPHDRMALIRSGQDWRDTDGEARERWDRDIRPVLREGMDFLSTEGRTIGCYTNRLMQLTDGDALIEKTYGHSWWHSLAELEKWSRSHKTHLRIFGVFGQFVKHFRSAAGLRLHHEVSVLDAEQMRFEYLRCHDRTGLLAACAG